MNILMIINILGYILEFEGVFLILPAVVAVIYKESTICFVYLMCALISFATGFVFRLFKPKNKEIYAREGFATVSLSWIIMSLFGALPFVLTGEIPNFINALFETASGFSTTGASILNDVEALSHGTLFWRSFTHWIGGMGVFVFIMALLPMLGASSMNLMKAESPGPSVSKLVPRVRDTAKILYELYMGITLLCFLSLVIARMPLFDAVTLTFGTLGTGGFGVLNDSIASYTTAQQVIITVFMILSGVNYSVYFCLIRRKFKDAFSIEEVRWYFLIILSSIVMITINLKNTFPSVGETIKHASFQVASIITTTGYSTADFNLWPEFSKMILLALMFSGACAGSTGGGMKVSRIIILVKEVKAEVLSTIHPGMVKKVRMDKRTVSAETLRQTNVFISIYCLFIMVSVLLLSFDSLDFTTNFTAVIATLNNIGPGLNKVGASGNYAMYSSFSKIILIFDMIAGRLELFPMLVLLFPESWKRK